MQCDVEVHYEHMYKMQVLCELLFMGWIVISMALM
jgi:hypothetical protein